MTGLVRPLRSPVTLPSPARSWRLVQRNLLVYRHGWMIIFSGFFEPLFYLLGIGFGLGSIVGSLPGPGGASIPYAAFVAPALLASSCMNGAITDGFFNIFFKLNYQRTYEGVLATPLGVPDVALGEMIWALSRGSLYAAAFLIVMLAMGLVLSPWAILALPAAILVSAAFSAGALAITGFVRKIQDFDIVMGLVVMPMFLFSGTFFPLYIYPEPVRIVVQLTPLYHGVALLRALTTGAVGPAVVLDVAYLVVMLAVGLTIATLRLQQRIIK
ncbi:MAG: ABC transporter permease [Candidatus Limnocylindria bacterium]